MIHNDPMYPNDTYDSWYKGQGLWPEIPPAQWNDWIWQLQNRITRLEDLQKYISLTPSEIIGCLQANKKLALSITPYFFNLIDIHNPHCPIRKQVIPSAEEMITSEEESLDPVGEEQTMPVKNLVHRYPDRLLFLVTDRCASYCRYCTRSRLVSNAQDYGFHPEFEEGLRYIEQTSSIRDVLISGGDPLLLSDKKIDYLLSRLRNIRHIEFIRIGSRIPVFLPQRITPELVDIFKKYGPIWMSIHVNHPKECTLSLKQACEQLSFGGVVLGNQSVLLKGVNDDIQTMKSLVHRLLMMRVRPYYLYQCDLITGSRHLRTSVEKGLDIIQGLRGHTTGYAVPQYIIDAPNGGGKIPINPEYIQSMDKQHIFLKNYQGRSYTYPIVTQSYD